MRESYNLDYPLLSQFCSLRDTISNEVRSSIISFASRRAVRSAVCTLPHANHTHAGTVRMDTVGGEYSPGEVRQGAYEG